MFDRRRFRPLAILVSMAAIASVLLASTAFAGQFPQQSAASGPVAPLLGAPQSAPLQAPPVPKAFSNLFSPRFDIVVDVVASKPGTVQGGKSRVVCGLTVFQADPSIDPKFVLKPLDRNVKYTMRTIEPSICK